MDATAAQTIVNHVAEHFSWLENVVVPLISTVVGAIVGALIAVFAPKILPWFYHPTLTLRFKKGNANCECLTPDTESGRSFYIRLQAENMGKETAKGCRVYIRRITELRADGEPGANYLSDLLPLTWAARQARGPEQEEYKPLDLPVGIQQFVDVLWMMPKRTEKMVPLLAGFNLATRIKLLRYEEFFSKRDRFRIHVLVTADNCEPCMGYFDFHWKGWLEADDHPNYSLDFQAGNGDPPESLP